jgi:hypothetical protein
MALQASHRFSLAIFAGFSPGGLTYEALRAICGAQCLVIARFALGLPGRNCPGTRIKPIKHIRQFQVRVDDDMAGACRMPYRMRPLGRIKENN